MSKDYRRGRNDYLIQSQEPVKRSRKREPERIRVKGVLRMRGIKVPKKIRAEGTTALYIE